MFHSQISCHQVLPSPGSARAWRHHQRRSSGFSPSMKAQRMRRIQQITRSLQTLPFRHRTPYWGQHQCLCAGACLVFAEFQQSKPREQSLFRPTTPQDQCCTLKKRKSCPFCWFFGGIPLPGETQGQLCSHYTLLNVFIAVQTTQYSFLRIPSLFDLSFTSWVIFFFFFF